MADRSGPGRTVARSGRSAGDEPSDATGDDAGPAVSTASSDAPTVVERTVYRDGGPDGTVEAAIVYEIPDAVSRLAFWIERPDVEIAATDGFERSGVGEYTWQGPVDGPAFEWDGTGERATVIVRQPLATDEPATYGAGTTSAGTTTGPDDWSLLLRPRTHTRWRYRGREPRIEREATVRGTGIAGEQFALLGPYALAERHRDDETLRLVVPDAAELAASSAAILDSLAAASERLDVGGHNSLVTVFAAPTAGVDWAHRGLSLGPDARVNDVAPLAAPTNIWVHEYAHTRQDRAATTPGTEWLLEATAEYYAVTQAFERGAIGFETYRHVLERGCDDASAATVLADPTTWVDDAQYRKGALVVAALDRRIRAATDGAATFQAVLRAWNDAGPETFDAVAFADAVEAAGGPAARAAAIAYTRTPTTPTCWNAATHAATFDLSAADCDVEVGTGASVAAPASAAEGGADRGLNVAIDRTSHGHS